MKYLYLFIGFITLLFSTDIYAVTTVRGHTEMPISVVTLGGADRRWEHNSDEDKAGYLNFHYKALKGKRKMTFSLGGMYRDKQRTNFFNQYDFRPYDESKPEGMQNNLIKGVDWNSYDEIRFMVFTPYGSVGNPLNYDASEKIGAGYGMMDFSLSNIQIIIGVRAENTNQGYNLRYAIDGVKNIGDQKYTDILPSVHAKYSPIEKSNIRASYFKSINRPGFFEIVPYRIINEEYVETGNPDLKHTVVHNVNMRFEYFPKPSEQMMLGLFYKKLYDPIEYGMVTQGQSSFYTPTNFGDAVNYGLEADVIKYFRSFGIKANYTFTQSNITATKLFNYDNPNPDATDRILIKNVEQSRPLNGQAKHVANATLIYKNVNSGWDAQVSFSYTGDRLYAVSRFVDNDIWQGSYIQLDAAIEKRFQFGLSLFAKASNLLNTPMVHFLKQQNPFNVSVEGYKDYKGGTLVQKDYYGQMIQVGCRIKL
jgi:Outer membrane receptor proteins, mostly Fe transport